MRNKLIPRTYKCKCGAEVREYVWDSNVNKQKFKCKCGATLGFKDIKVDKVGSLTSIRTPTKNR
jgi:hypothetical protein